MSVNAIRKQSTDEEITSLAKSLIKSWKKLLGTDALSFFIFSFLDDFQINNININSFTWSCISSFSLWFLPVVMNETIAYLKSYSFMVILHATNCLFVDVEDGYPGKFSSSLLCVLDNWEWLKHEEKSISKCMFF